MPQNFDVGVLNFLIVQSDHTNTIFDLEKYYSAFTKPPYRTWSGGRSNRPLHSQLMGVSGIVPGKIMERPANCEAGGFVNSAVR